MSAKHSEIAAILRGERGLKIKIIQKIRLNLAKSKVDLERKIARGTSDLEDAAEFSEKLYNQFPEHKEKLYYEYGCNTSDKYRRDIECYKEGINRDRKSITEMEEMLKFIESLSSD